MESTEQITVNKKTAEKFRKFSSSNFKSDTEALINLLDFFDNKRISPEDLQELLTPILDKALGRRLNIIVAVLKNIEKTQTKPTLAILSALIEHSDPSKQPLVVEKKNMSDEEDFWKVG